MKPNPPPSAPHRAAPGPRPQPSGAAALLLFATVLATHAATPRPATPPAAAPTIRGFNAPITEGNRTVARVTGTEARPSLLAGEVQITGFRLETYRYPASGERQTELVVESAFGAFGGTGASSDRSLTLRSADDRFAITGDGWGWNRTTGLLVISNNVLTTLRRPGTATNRPPVEVRSRRFEYNLRTGDARFLDDCSAVEPGQARITAGILTSQLGARTERPDTILATNGVTLELLRPGREGRATGTHAAYSQSPDGERIELEGNPTWSFGPGEGSADHLVLLPARDAYSARGHARLRLLRPPPANPPANRAPSPNPVSEPLDIEAESIEGGPKEIVFTGPVHASQGTRLDLRATRVVASLDSSPSPNPIPPPAAGSLPAMVRPTRVEATGGATARVGTATSPLEMAGERMVYTPGETETIEVTGNPRWNGETHRGSADRFVIHPRGPSFEAVNRVRVAWHSATPPNPGTPVAPIELTADRMTVDPRAARFSGTVQARRDTWNVDCADLEFGLGTNALPRSFTARGGVLLDYLMPAPRPGSTNLLSGTADRLVDLATEQARRWRIRSEEVHADLAANGAEPVALDATGKVRIDHTEITATGARLTYRAEEGLMHLTGDSRLDTRNGLVIVGRPDSALSFDPRAPRFSVQRSWQTLRLPGRLLRGATNTPSSAAQNAPPARR